MMNSSEYPSVSLATQQSMSFWHSLSWRLSAKAKRREQIRSMILFCSRASSRESCACFITVAYSVSKKSLPEDLWQFFQNGWEFFNQILGTWTFRTLDYSYPGLFVPSTGSYLGLFIPSWTVRTMDYSFHHWTIRTVMQDSQKLTFPTKMCRCSVWVKRSHPPLNWLTFSPNGWDFLVQILLSDYAFLSTLDYNFLFNYLQLWQSCAILSATTIIRYARNVHHLSQHGTNRPGTVRTVQGTNSPWTVGPIASASSNSYTIIIG